MKKNTLKNIALFTLVFAMGCKQEVLDLKTPEVPVDTSCEDASSGTADFSKFIVVGTSFTAGFQAGALFTAGQDASLGVILNKDFSCAGAPEAFHQPDINSVLGFNLFVAPNPGADNRVIGRFLLQGADPKPTAQVALEGDLTGLPNPTFNPGFLVSPTLQSTLQNFSVETGQTQIPHMALVHFMHDLRAIREPVLLSAMLRQPVERSYFSGLVWTTTC